MRFSASFLVTRVCWYHVLLRLLFLVVLGGGGVSVPSRTVSDVAKVMTSEEPFLSLRASCLPGEVNSAGGDQW